MGKEYERDVLVLGQVPALGRLILYDSLEDLFKWSGVGTGADFEAEKVTDQAYNGDACLHMRTRATDPAQGDYVSVYRGCYQRPGKRYHVEFVWYAPQLLYSKYFYVRVYIEDGVTSHVPGIRYDGEFQRWEYQNSLGNWIPFTDGTQYFGTGAWHRVVLEFDEEDKEFVRFVSDAFEVDMRGTAYYSTAHAGELEFRPHLTLQNMGANRSEMWVDDFLVLEL